MKSHLLIYIKGMCMGVADVIPGISGGTLALMLGIYERLIGAIKSLSPARGLEFIQCWNLSKESSRQKLKELFKELDLLFLIILACGIFSAVLATSSIIPFLIFDYTEYTFACFLGLIAPSIYIPWKHIKKKAIPQYFAIFLGLTLTVASSLLMKNQAGEIAQQHSFATMSLILFFSALIAISAMILPGISGSFILMLLGQYIVVTGLIARFKVDIFKREISERKLAALKQVEHFTTLECLTLLAIFAIGCAIGILIMSRIIHFALQKAHDTTMAFLTGMICSSFYVLWPFKAPLPEGVEKTQWLKKAPNIIPDISSTTTTAAIIFLVAACFSVSLIIMDEKRSKA